MSSAPIINAELETFATPLPLNITFSDELFLTPVDLAFKSKKEKIRLLLLKTVTAAHAAYVFWGENSASLIACQKRIGPQSLSPPAVERDISQMIDSSHTKTQLIATDGCTFMCDENCSTGITGRNMSTLPTSVAALREVLSRWTVGVWSPRGCVVPSSRVCCVPYGRIQYLLHTFSTNGQSTRRVNRLPPRDSL